MADFKLPMSAGAETSSVSFDPRRQVSPLAGEETTQVTQPGGQPALNVADTIQQQFGDAEPVASADGFAADQAPANPRDVPREVAKMLEGKYITKKGVWKDINKKKDDLVRQKNKAFTAHVNKKKADFAQLKRRGAEAVGINAQAKRRLAQQQTVDNQMARRLRMQAGPEAPRPAQPQAPQIAPGEPAPTGNGPTPASDE